LGVLFEPVVEQSQSSPPVSDPTADSVRASAIPLQRDYALVACWPPRGESSEVCAERLFYLFDQFAGCDDILARWYEPDSANSSAPAREVDVQSKDALVDLLERRRSGDSPGNESDDPGFQVCLRNTPADSPAIELSIACGLGSPREANRLVMRFPQGLVEFGTLDRMILVVASVARAMDPHWAGVFARELADPATLVPDEPLLDWILYLCRQRCVHGTKVHYPGQICGLRSARLGAIFSAQPEPPDPAIPEHRQNIDRLRQVLGL
jgi:hypothetical protein